MKKPAQPNMTDHPEDLLLLYAEGLLTENEKHVVERHLGACAECSSEVDRLQETIAMLTVHREAFCPEEWELYEYAHYGTDPDGAIGKHLKRCESCRNVVEELTRQVSPSLMPAALWSDMRQQLPSPVRVAASAQPDSEGFLERVYRMFRFPALAAGLVTAVVLGFVLLKSPEMPQSVIALSSVGWTNAPKPKSLHRSEKSAAILLVVEDFDPPWSQERIDKLYDVLVPSVDVYGRFRIVSPRGVKASLDRSTLKLRDTKAVVAAIAKKLSLTTVVVVTITARGQAASVQADRIDPASGQVMAQETAAYVPLANLEATVKHLTAAAFAPSEKGKEPKSK